jgi:hypothetical protein
MSTSSPGRFTLAIHGGAGTILRSTMTPEREAAYHAGLRRALAAGHAVLAAGGPALDAVTAAVMALEDEPLFNAGRGAVYTSAGKQEMDAAVMNGQDHAAGAVAGICGPRNPVLAARAVMEKTEHVLLIGSAAMDFCRAQGLVMEAPEYFFTQARWDALQSTLAMRRTGTQDQDESRKHGTVGAVARDVHGHLAAATSTGGMTAKAPGRVGDTPVIRRRHLGRRRQLRRLGHRPWRSVHPLCRRAGNLGPHAAGRPDPGAGRARGGHGRAGPQRRERRRDRGGQGRRLQPAVQLRGHVPGGGDAGWGAADGDLRGGAAGPPALSALALRHLSCT